jgi:hypothetical protein
VALVVAVIAVVAWIWRTGDPAENVEAFEDGMQPRN